MPNGQPIHILLVDDDRMAREIVGKMLAALGYAVVVANDGHEALDAFGRNGIDLALTDINMPLMDGWQLARRLRSIRPDIPIVAITGENPDSVLDRLPGSAISHAMFKPFNVVVLRDILNVAFK